MTIEKTRLFGRAHIHTEISTVLSWAHSSPMSMVRYARIQYGGVVPSGYNPGTKSSDLLLLVTVGASALFPFVGLDLQTLAFLTAGHQSSV